VESLEESEEEDEDFGGRPAAAATLNAAATATPMASVLRRFSITSFQSAGL
jgi:hypothetical protein